MGSILTTPTLEILPVSYPNRLVGMTHQLASCTPGMNAFLGRALTLQVARVLLQHTLGYNTSHKQSTYYFQQASNHCD
jgi:hypothetical protein